ncbi:MAG: hypothetical protein ACR2HG_12010 [Pyrinomonadaceae bacterium]
MEILIVGIFIVALMVFVSTKIKKSAAQAFERETIETQDFRIIKPEGFVNPLREDSEFAFEAYSKDLGEKGERNIWKAQVYLTVSAGLNYKSVRDAAKRQVDVILSEKASGNKSGGERICLIEGEKTEKETSYYEFRKIVESRKQDKTYDLKISVLKSFRDEFAERIGEMIESFTVK